MLSSIAALALLAAEVAIIVAVIRSRMKRRANVLRRLGI